MNTLALLVKSGVSYNKSEGFWVRLDCVRCVGKQSKTVSFNYVKYFVECHRCGWRPKQGEFFHAIGIQQYATELEFVEDKPKSLVQDFPENCVEAWQDKRARAYLQSRGLTEAKTEQFGFFFCREGRYADRLILPVFDHKTRYRTYQGRTIQGDEPKYLNASGGQLSSLLYGLHWNFHKRNSVWLVEGIFDAIHVFPYGIAPFSKNISDTQIDLLLLSGCKEVVMLFDHDSHADTPEKHRQNVRKLSRYFFVRDVHLPHSSPTEFSMDEIRSMIRETSYTL